MTATLSVDPIASSDFGSYTWVVSSPCGAVTSSAATLTEVTSAPCPADLNGDHTVGLTDLSILLSNFGVGSGAAAATGDINGDGAVNLTDLSQLLAVFGTNCP
ncbi:MAG: dockerin type I domain-containing protein [Phycisphaerae bacterium]